MAEDGTFADVHDDAVTIAEDEVVGVVHPVHLGGTLPLWSEIFADYRIVQPFAQLGREVAGLTGAEAAAAVLTRFEGRRVPVGAVLGLESRGWRRAAPGDGGGRRGTAGDGGGRRGTAGDGGVQTAVTMSPARGPEFVLGLEPGISVGAVDLFPEQTLGVVEAAGRVATFGDLDPAAVSELIRDLAMVTAGHGSAPGAIEQR